MNRRDDLCSKGQSALYYLSDYGCVVRTKRGWWASNEKRTDLIGEWASIMLAQPTVGPYKSAKQAHTAYEQAHAKIRERIATKSATETT